MVWEHVVEDSLKTYRSHTQVATCTISCYKMQSRNTNIGLHNKSPIGIEQLKIQLRDLFYDIKRINEQLIGRLAEVTDMRQLVLLGRFPTELQHVCYDSNVYQSVQAKIRQAEEYLSQ